MCVLPEEFMSTNAQINAKRTNSRFLRVQTEAGNAKDAAWPVRPRLASNFQPPQRRSPNP
jgi:hypothetical protein